MTEVQYWFSGGGRWQNKSTNNGIGRLLVDQVATPGSLLAVTLLIEAEVTRISGMVLTISEESG